MNSESLTNVLTRQWRIVTGSKTVNPRNRMPETGASGSVGAPLEESEGATRQRLPPHFVGLPSNVHLFRFSLDQASLRRWEGNGTLRSTALRSFLATAVNLAKPCRLGTQAGSFSGDQKILSDLRRRICRKHRYITSSADFRSTVIGRCQTNRLTSRFVTTQLQAQCTLRHESRWGC
jgi:hypothetical protein